MHTIQSLRIIMSLILLYPKWTTELFHGWRNVLLGKDFNMCLSWSFQTEWASVRLLASLPLIYVECLQHWLFQIRFSSQQKSICLPRWAFVFANQLSAKSSSKGKLTLVKDTNILDASLLSCDFSQSLGQMWGKGNIVGSRGAWMRGGLEQWHSAKFSLEKLDESVWHKHRDRNLCLRSWLKSQCRVSDSLWA